MVLRYMIWRRQFYDLTFKAQGISQHPRFTTCTTSWLGSSAEKRLQSLGLSQGKRYVFWFRVQG